MTKRKFHLRSYNNHHTVYEILPRGERAVSPSYASIEDAKRALLVLNETNVARIQLGFISRLMGA